MHASDRFIMQRMREGDSAAFRVVFDRNYVVLYRFACQLLHDKVLAEEVTDDVILYLWQNCNRIEIAHSIRAYLMQALKTRCIDSLRAAGRYKTVSVNAVSTADNLSFLEQVFVDDTQPMGMLLSHELENVLNRSIENLPKECGEVFRQSRCGGKRYEQIAKDMGISVNTVKYHIKNALALLRKDLAVYLRWVALALLVRLFE